MSAYRLIKLGSKVSDIYYKHEPTRWPKNMPHRVYMYLPNEIHAVVRFFKTENDVAMFMKKFKLIK